MKARLIIALLVLVVSSEVMNAQVYKTRQLINDIYQLDEYIKRRDKGIDFSDTSSYTGTPYNHPSYLSGNVYMNDELLATNVALRYNAIADEMEIKESLASPDEDAKVLTKSPEVFVKIMNKDIYVFVPYKGGIEGGGYFHVLYEGNKYDLFKKPKKKFSPAKPATTSITRDIPAAFADKPVYYIVNKNGKFYELPDSKNKMLKVFADNKNVVKDYINDNRLDIKKERDLIRLIRYYDGIGAKE